MQKMLNSKKAYIEMIVGIVSKETGAASDDTFPANISKKEQKREWKKRRREEKKRQRKRDVMADQSVFDNETPDKEPAEIEAEEGMPCAMEKTRIETQSHEKTERHEEQLKRGRKQILADKEIEENVILSNEKNTDSIFGSVRMNRGK